MKKSRFHFGEWVKVTATCSMEYVHKDEHSNETERMAIRTPCNPFRAVVIGAKYRQTGTYNPATGGSSNWYGDSEYEPAFLSVDKTILVWLVTIGMTNKPIEVLDEDIESDSLQEYPVYLPWRVCSQPPYDDRVRKELSDAAKAMPRKNGKFSKKESSS